MRRQILHMIAAMMAWIPVAAGAEMALVVVEQPGCIYCEAFDTEIAPAYPKTSEGAFAPLRRVQLRDLPDDITFESRPILTPTFVVVDDGQELGRIEGYPGDLFFWPLLAELLRDEAGFAPEAIQ